MSVQYITTSTNFNDVTLVIMAVTLGLTTLASLYTVFSNGSYDVQPSNLLSMHNKIEEYSGNLTYYIRNTSPSIAPDNLTDIQCMSRYTRLKELCLALRDSLDNMAAIHRRLEQVRGEITPDYFNQYTTDLNRLTDNYTFIIDALRSLESQILLIDPN